MGWLDRSGLILQRGIAVQALPPGSLLERYQRGGNHTDCYTAVVPGAVPLSVLVTAFYSSAAFRPERVLLGLVLGKRAGAADVAALAAGEIEQFSAWTVEARNAEQLLLCDYQHRTRSWLMVAPGDQSGTTRLYFGSAVTRTGQSRTMRWTEAAVFNSLLWFHRLYSRVLLAGAVRGLAASS